MTETRANVRTPSWLWIVGIWCAGALFDASQAVLIMRAEGHHGPWPLLFVTELALWLPWALATPLVIRLARSYRIVRSTSVRAYAVHFVVFAALSIVSEVWSAWLQVLFNPWGNRVWPKFVDTFSTSLTFQVVTFLIAYALILTVTYLADARESIARHMTETARLNEELSKAQLAALRRQIEPHFIYNTLNAIAGLVRDEKSEAAVSMIVGLSEFLRRTSEDSHRSQVTLAEEVEYLQRYLELQKVRFGERLQVSVDIPSALLRAQVPNLLLQPLVENAIKHGIAKRVAGGSVRVAGVRRNGTLSLSVYNDGPSDMPTTTLSHSGIGIGNLRSRLRMLYGSDSGLDFRRSGAEGVEVTVVLPFMEA